MKIQEAIEILKHEHDYAQLLSYVNEALKMAISALEKQIPKRCIFTVHKKRDFARIVCLLKIQVPTIVDVVDSCLTLTATTQPRKEDGNND